MLATIFSAAVVGLEGQIVRVEVDISHGLPAFTIVGLPDAAVNESRERVRSAIRNTGATFPLQRITVNLAPADIRKEGPAYDLPIAMGILAASGQLSLPEEPALFVGELGLDGTLRRANGILPMILTAEKQGITAAFLPSVNADEGALLDNVAVYPVRNLTQLLRHCIGESSISPQPKLSCDELLAQATYPADMQHIKGQEQAKRALELAAAGGHNVRMMGPPGSGKTLLARTFPSIMPAMTLEEAIEVTKIYSVGGYLRSDQALVTQRPFRSPHHTTSGIALVGGGKWPRPGEISLAHRGVLFMDEFPEFSSAALEGLRQPLEDGVVSITRVQGSVTFPAKNILIAAMNPCPCGFATDPDKTCTCSPMHIARYQKRLSGPLLDRIDLHLEVPRLSYEKLQSIDEGESSATIRARVEASRALQRERFAGTAITCNAEMGPKEVKAFCALDEEGERMLALATEHMFLSARGVHRILKLARTIADISNQPTIATAHVAEALQYRMK